MINTAEIASPKAGNWKRSDTKASVFLYLSFFLLSSVFSFFLHIPPSQDEFCSLATTAFLCGDDWSLLVQSLGGFYYKPLLSVFYLPAYLLFRNHLQSMYTFMLLQNMAVVSFVPVIAYRLLVRYFGVDQPKHALLTAAASCGLSSVWLYSYYARSEVLLILFSWVALYTLVRFVYAESPKAECSCALILGLTSILAFGVHTRGTVLLIAVFLCFCSAFFLRKKRDFRVLLLYVLTMALLFALIHVFSTFCKKGVFKDFPIAHNTLESFDWSSLRKMLSSEGLRTLFRMVTGWLFNLFASTYGLAILGIGAGVYFAVSFRDSTPAERMSAAFSLLLAAGSFAAGILFFFNYGYEFVTGAAETRPDRLFFGRYMVCAVSPLVFMAFRGLYRKIFHSRPAFIVTAAVYVGTAAVFLVTMTSRYTDTLALGWNFISLTTFLNYTGARGTDTYYLDLKTALSLSALLGFFILCAVLLFRKKRFYRAAAVVLAVSCLNFAVVMVRIRIPESRYLEKTYLPAVESLQELDRTTGFSSSYPCIDVYSKKRRQILQYFLPGCQISKDSDMADYADNCLMVSTTLAAESCVSAMEKAFGEAPCYIYQVLNASAGNYSHVILVRGDALANLLQEKGIALEPYTPDSFRSSGQASEEDD